MAKEKVRLVQDHWGYVFVVSYAGALIYFVERNVGFWGDVLAFFQAAVWPAYIMHAVLRLLKI